MPLRFSRNKKNTATTKNNKEPNDLVNNQKELTEAKSEQIDICKIIENNLRPSAGYKVVKEIFVNTKERFVLGSKQSLPSWRVLSAKPDFQASEDIILDNHGYVNPNQPSNFSVGQVNEEDLAKIAVVPPKFRKQIEKKVFDRIDKPDDYRKEDLQSYLAKSNVFFKSIPRIVDPNCVKNVDFVSLVDSLVSWKCDKDQRVRLFLKKDLLRGITPKLNPVSLCGKPPQVGMGEFYLQFCLMLGSKVTKKSLLGYATSPLDVYPGVIDGQDLTACVEQIESSDYLDIFGHLYTISVQGCDFVSSGATRFQINSSSPFTFLFNIENAKEPESDFNFMLNKIASNQPAFLQRVSNILYEPNLRKLEPKTKDFSEWVERGAFFRGVEQIAMPKLRKLFDDPKIWKWAIEPIENYTKEAKDIIEGLEDSKLKYAFSEHIKPPFSKLKGSALRVVVAENLGEILISDNLDVDTDLLVPAEEYLGEYVNQNLNSIINLTQSWDKQINSTMWNVFHQVFPVYVRLLVSTVNFYRYCNPSCAGKEVPIKSLSKYYSGTANYEYLSMVVKNFKKGGGKVALSRYNDYFKMYYAFEIIKKGADSLFVKFAQSFENYPKLEW